MYTILITRLVASIFLSFSSQSSMYLHFIDQSKGPIEPPQLLPLAVTKETRRRAPLRSSIPGHRLVVVLISYNAHRISLFLSPMRIRPPFLCYPTMPLESSWSSSFWPRRYARIALRYLSRVLRSVPPPIFSFVPSNFKRHPSASALCAFLSLPRFPRRPSFSFPLAFALEDPLLLDRWGLFQASLSISVGSNSSPLHYYAVSCPVASTSLSAERMTRWRQWDGSNAPKGFMGLFWRVVYRRAGAAFIRGGGYQAAARAADGCASRMPVRTIVLRTYCV